MSLCLAFSWQHHWDSCRETNSESGSAHHLSPPCSQALASQGVKMQLGECWARSTQRQLKFWIRTTFFIPFFSFTIPEMQARQMAVQFLVLSDCSKHFIWEMKLPCSGIHVSGARWPLSMCLSHIRFSVFMWGSLHMLTCVGCSLIQMCTYCTVPENLMQVYTVFFLQDSPLGGISATGDAVPALHQDISSMVAHTRHSLCKILF